MSKLPALKVGTEVIPLECDRIYVVRLPSDAPFDELDEVARVLALLRLSLPEAEREHAPRFMVVRRDIEVELENGEPR